MPVSMDAFEALAGELLAMYERTEHDLLTRINRRLMRGVRQQGWAERKYAEVKKQSRDTQRIIDVMRKERLKATRMIIIQAYGASSKAFVEEAKAVAGIRGLSPLPPDSEKALVILSELNRCLDASDRIILRKVNDAYADIVGRSAAAVTTGKTTVRDAVREQVNRFADRGIASFVDRAGRSWEMATYAEMATLTAVERATRSGYVDTMREYGFDLAEISSHYGACPLCEAWENVIVSVTGATRGYPSLADAESSGCFHPRCLHHLSTYYEGISKHGRNAPREVSDRPNEGYSARARQRALERHIRRWKRRMVVADTPDEEREAYARVRMYQQSIRGLIRRYNRETDRSLDWLPRKYWREGGRVRMSDAAKRLRP